MAQLLNIEEIVFQKIKLLSYQKQEEVLDFIEFLENKRIINEKKEAPSFQEDPVFLIEGHESNAPIDLSINSDRYLYGDC